MYSIFFGSEPTLFVCLAAGHVQKVEAINNLSAQKAESDPPVEVTEGCFALVISVKLRP